MATIQCDAAREAQRKLTEQLEEAEAELTKALEWVEALEGERGHDEPGWSERSHHDELHSRHSTDKVQPRKPSGKEESSKDGDSETTQPVPPKDTWRCGN